MQVWCVGDGCGAGAVVGVTCVQEGAEPWGAPVLVMMAEDG